MNGQFDISIPMIDPHMIYDLLLFM